MKKRNKEDLTLREKMVERNFNEGDTLKFNGNDARTLCLVEEHGVLCFVRRSEEHNSIVIDLPSVTIEHIPCSGFIALVLPDGRKASMWHRELFEGFSK